MHVTFLFGLIVPASYEEYTALVKSGNVASKGAYCWWKPGYRDLLSYVTWICGLSFVVFPSARVNWCSCASVVIFFEQCCDQFVV